jgi:hypothetical protein
VAHSGLRIDCADKCRDEVCTSGFTNMRAYDSPLYMRDTYMFLNDGASVRAVIQRR